MAVRPSNIEKYGGTLGTTLSLYEGGFPKGRQRLLENLANNFVSGDKVLIMKALELVFDILEKRGRENRRKS